MSRIITIYIAGPGVFSPGVVEDGKQKKEICARYGFLGLYPLDNEIDFGPVPEENSKRIACGNEDYIRNSHITVADLTPFRGAEPDSGTCYEIGFSRCMGHPVYAYVPHNLKTNEVVDKYYGPVSKVAENYFDRNGARIENFGHQVNLMLHNGTTIVRGSFEDCIKQIRKDLDNGVLETGDIKTFKAWDIEANVEIPANLVALTGDRKILTRYGEDEEWAEEVIPIAITELITSLVPAGENGFACTKCGLAYHGKTSPGINYCPGCGRKVESRNI